MIKTTTILLSILSYTAAFTVTSPTNLNHRVVTTFDNTSPKSRTALFAGGFEWEDPAEAFDQGVDNPYKNPELNLLTDTSKASESSSGDDAEGGESLVVDPARLLGPRLSGSNLYFVGMMGSGKSAVGDIIARREYYLDRNF